MVRPIMGLSIVEGFDSGLHGVFLEKENKVAMKTDLSSYLLIESATFCMDLSASDIYGKLASDRVSQKYSCLKNH